MVLLYKCAHYTFRGGHSGLGAYCGVFYVYLRNAAGATSWNLGAALSFRLSTHYPLHGGHSYSDTNCGAFLLDIYAFPTRSDWHRGAALS